MAPAAAAVVGAVVKSSDLVARRIARQAYERPWLQKPASKLIFLLSWSLNRVCVSVAAALLYICNILPYSRRRRWLLPSVAFAFRVFLQADCGSM